MQLVIKDGKVIATHTDQQRVAELYPACEIVTGIAQHGDTDPRTEEEKRNAYRDRRRVAYPPLADQLDMIYWDRINGTTHWQDMVARVKAQYPKA